jgi:hypothetical protein
LVSRRISVVAYTFAGSPLDSSFIKVRNDDVKVLVEDGDAVAGTPAVSRYPLGTARAAAPVST